MATERTQPRKHVKSIPDAYLTCRSLGHPWRYLTVDESRRSEENVLVQELICSGCTSLKYQTFDADTGEITNTRYRYSEGYLIKGLGRLTKSDRGYIRLRAAGTV